MTAYHFTAILRLAGREIIRFEPIVDFPRLSVPFTYSPNDRIEIEGYIRLVGASDPLWVAIRNPPMDEPLIARAWALSLLGFAALTCPLAPAPSGTWRPSSERAPNDRTRQRAAERSLPSRTFWSSQLRMSIERGEAIPNLVCAHRRLLPPGQSASEQAIHAALHVGIHLASGETWVRGHTRGGATLTEAAFAWSCPESRYLPRLSPSAS